MKLDCDIVVIPSDGKSTRTIYARGTPGKKLVSWACTRDNFVPIALFPLQHVMNIPEDGRAKVIVGPFPTNFGSLRPIVVNVAEEGSGSASEHFILHLVRPRET